MEYLLTGLLVAAVLAAIVVFRPRVYEALFPWLKIIAISSVLLVFASLYGRPAYVHEALPTYRPG
jgi:hypothetical protein